MHLHHIFNGQIASPLRHLHHIFNGQIAFPSERIFKVHTAAPAAPSERIMHLHHIFNGQIASPLRHIFNVHTAVPLYRFTNLWRNFHTNPTMSGTRKVGERKRKSSEWKSCFVKSNRNSNKDVTAVKVQQAITLGYRGVTNVRTNSGLVTQLLP